MNLSAGEDGVCVSANERAYMHVLVVVLGGNAEKIAQVCKVYSIHSTRTRTQAHLLNSKKSTLRKPSKPWRSRPSNKIQNCECDSIFEQKGAILPLENLDAQRYFTLSVKDHHYLCTQAHRISKVMHLSCLCFTCFRHSFLKQFELGGNYQIQQCFKCRPWKSVICECAENSHRQHQIRITYNTFQIIHFLSVFWRKFIVLFRLLIYNTCLRYACAIEKYQFASRAHPFEVLFYIMWGKIREIRIMRSNSIGPFLSSIFFCIHFWYS